MLQNRVDPFGNLIKTPARGAWMGNRGVIHNHKREIIRLFKHKAWIICKLEFKGRKRSVMTPDRWTELFFLDEATAFAAGHRPCFECRREDAMRFKSSWIDGNAFHEFNMKTPISDIDEVMHKERIRGNGRLYQLKSQDIPDGTFIQRKGEAYLFHQGQIYKWAPNGYDDPEVCGSHVMLDVLTPLSIVNAFRAGYIPQMSIGKTGG